MGIIGAPLTMVMVWDSGTPYLFSMVAKVLSRKFIFKTSKGTIERALKMLCPSPLKSCSSFWMETLFLVFILFLI